MHYPAFDSFLSWEDYLTLDQSGELRHEYYDGEIIALAGATNRHNEIVTNLTVAFKPRATKQGCKFYSESVKLFRHRSDRYLYPDGMLTCNPLDQQSKNGVRSPLLLVEVISKSSIQYDFGFKLKAYMAIPSLKHYLVVYQEECIVHHFARNQDDSWTFTLHADMNQSLTIEELDAEISLAAIYQGIEFGPEITYAEEEAARYQAEVESE